MEEKILSEIKMRNMCCASCASKIETASNKLDGVNNARVDVLSGKIFVETEDKAKTPGLISQIIEIAKSIEPAIEIIMEDNIDAQPEKKRYTAIIEMTALSAGALLFFCALIFKPSFAPVMYVVSYLLIGTDILFFAVRNLLKGHVFDENFLMSIATLGAFWIGEYPEGAAVMLFYKVGELFQDMAVNRSRRSIESLLNLNPEYANIKSESGITQVKPESVSIGDIIIIRPGERVPLDAKVISGSTYLDTSALTGESMPRYVQSGDEIMSGSINKEGLIEAEVTKNFSDSTVSKILEMVQNASAKKAKTEKFITRFAVYYTPFVVITAVLLAVIPPMVIEGAVFSQWLSRALVFLVVSCPCALVISIPLSFFGGIGGASKNGILIKGGNYLEALNNVKTFVFDKTGTLTKGEFSVGEVEEYNGYGSDEILRLAAHAEMFSTHPLAVSICSAYKDELDASLVSDYEEIAGHGVSAKVGDDSILAGNALLMEKYAIDTHNHSADMSVVYIAVNGKLAGAITLADTVRPDSAETIKRLKEYGAENIVMLTGDNRNTADAVAQSLGITEVYAELLPHQKVEVFDSLKEKYSANGARLAFIGDGLNDAPVLASSDVGITMGSIGSDAAIEASDIVLMTDEPSKVVTAYLTAQKTRRIVTQNIVFALGVKAVILALGAVGIATMWEAVFGDVGVALIAILNSIRAARI